VIDLQLFTLTKERRHFFSKENCKIISLAVKREPNIIKESTLQLSSVIPLKKAAKNGGRSQQKSTRKPCFRRQIASETVLSGHFEQQQ